MVRRGPEIIPRRPSCIGYRVQAECRHPAVRGVCVPQVDLMLPYGGACTYCTGEGWHCSVVWSRGCAATIWGTENCSAAHRTSLQCAYMQASATVLYTMSAGFVVCRQRILKLRLVGLYRCGTLSLRLVVDEFRSC